MIAIDVETTGLNPWTDRLLGLSVYDGTVARYYRWGGRDCVFPFPYDMLRDSTQTIVGHNLRFDVKFLKVNGVEVNCQWQDTKLMAQLIDENRPLDLKSLAVKHLGKDSLRAKRELDQHLKSLKLKMKDLGDPRVDLAIVSRYCNEDTANTWKLYHILEQQLARTPDIKKYYDEEMLPLEQVLLDMELRGNIVDETRLVEAELNLGYNIARILQELNGLLHSEIDAIREGLLERARGKFKTQAKRDSILKPDFNWGSSEQKRELFYGHLGLGKYTSATTKKGKPALDRKTLLALTLPAGKLKTAIDLQIDLQTYNKMRSTHVAGIRSRLVHGIIHGEYYQASGEEWARSEDTGGTVTGRLSHRNPNLGNLPRKTKDYWKGTFVKDLFLPRTGQTFIYADYSQIELRMAAHLSQDGPFITSFTTGQDPHQQTATELGISRQQAKTVNFLLIYYGSAWRLAYELGLDPTIRADLTKAEAIRNGFFQAHPQLYDWIKKQMRDADDRGYITSMFGRRRRLPDIWNHHEKDGKVRAHAFKQAGNFVVQSAAASVCKRAMISLYHAGFVIVNQVHDSVTCMVPEHEASDKLAEMCHIMRTAVSLSIPLEVDGKIIKTFKE